MTMPLLLNPLLEGLQAARRAATHPDDVTVDDRGDRWLFEFASHADALGGGARVAITKNGFRVISIVREQ